MRLPLDRAAVPRRLAEIRRRRLGQALARLVGGEALRQLAAHQQRDGKLDAGAPVVGIERQRAAEAADGLVDAAEIAQAERQIEEALAVVAVERDRLEVMLHRLVEPIGGAQRIAEVGMQRGIVGVGRERQAMMRHRGFELADQPAAPRRDCCAARRDRAAPPAAAGRTRSPRRAGRRDGPARPVAAAGRNCRHRCRTTAWVRPRPADSGLKG